MNPDEELSFKFLKTHFSENVVFEPDGKIPPDFVIDSIVAIEARRLNKQFFDKTNTEGLEQLSIPIRDIFSDVLKSFDSQYSGNSYWVSINFSRPLLTTLRKAKRDMKVALKAFLGADVFNFPYKLRVNDNIVLTINASEPIKGRIFRQAGGLDKNRGGHLVQMYIENINFCIKEKSTKITNYLSKYCPWWLLLVDHMGWGLDKKETEDVFSSIKYLGIFEKVLIISSDGENLLLTISKSNSS